MVHRELPAGIASLKVFVLIGERIGQILGLDLRDATKLNEGALKKSGFKVSTASSTQCRVNNHCGGYYLVLTERLPDYVWKKTLGAQLMQCCLRHALLQYKMHSTFIYFFKFGQ